MEKVIMVVDTETTSIDKKFCYDIGYVICKINEFGAGAILEEKNFLVKQVWRNTMLFSTAYYADKKPIYTKMLRDKKNNYGISVLRYDEIMVEVQKSIDRYSVEIVYAYNSGFDEKVFQFNCDWFKVENPFAELPFYDIRAYFMNSVKDSLWFKGFCNDHELYTESGNYSTTAETAYKFIACDTDFIESHTALNDSQIELDILRFCAASGEDIFSPMVAPKMLERKTIKEYLIKTQQGVYSFNGWGATWYKKKNTLVIK